MNKIIQINLAGQAVAIDEQAYSILSKYLGTLESHFQNTESGKEILEDIEARIAELFFTKLKSNSFINEAHVNEAIELMGTAKEMGVEDDFIEDNNQSHSKSDDKSKKLFRDPDDRVFGGVCSGLGAYFGLDASTMRIIFVLFVLFAGAPILAYIILWVIIPEAKTPQDRYRMNGDASTISDIANNVRDEANRVSNNLLDGANNLSDQLKKNSNFNQTGKDVVHGLGQVLSFFGKAFGAFVLCLLVIIGITICIVLISNAAGGINAQFNGINYTAPALFTSPTLNWVFSISLLSLIILPICTVGYAILQFIFNWSTKVNIKGVFIAWLLSLAVFIGTTVYSARQVNVDGIHEFIDKIEDNTQNFSDKIDQDLDSFADELDREWNRNLDSI